MQIQNHTQNQHTQNEILNIMPIENQLVRISKPLNVTKEALNFNELVELFLLDIDVKPQSKQTYKRCLKQFIIFVEKENLKLNELNRTDILSFKNYLLSIKLSGYTVSNYIVSVRKFFEYLESNKIYPNVAKSIKGMRGVKGFKKDVLTVRQCVNILNSIDTNTVAGLRDFAITNILINTGLRTVELMRADVSDIKQQGGEAMLYIQGKGRDFKDDFVVLTDNVLISLNAYLKARNAKNNEPLFTSLSDRNLNKRLTTKSISRIIKTLLIKNNLISDRLSAHSLRHTAITLSLLSGASLQETQQLARHSNINTTMIYAHNIKRLENPAERKIQKFLQDNKNG